MHTTFRRGTAASMLAAALVTLPAAVGSAATITGPASQAHHLFETFSSSTLSGPPGVFFRAGTSGSPYDYNTLSAYQVAVTTSPPPQGTTATVDYAKASPVTFSSIISIHQDITLEEQASVTNISYGGAGQVLTLPGPNDSALRLRFNQYDPITTSTASFQTSMVKATSFSDGGEIYGSSPLELEPYTERWVPIDVNPLGVTTNHTVVFGAPGQLVDKLPDGSYRYDNTVGPAMLGPTDGSSNEFIMDLGQLGVADKFDVLGILIGTRNDFKPDMDIFAGDGVTWSPTPLAHVVSTAAFNEMFIVKFDDFVYTSHLRFVQAPNTTIILLKAIPLTVPEPAGVLALSFGLPLLARRGRRD